MNGRPKLRVDWCDHKATTLAVTRWHYSRTMPMPPMQSLGAWEDDRFISAIIFAKGANHALNQYFGLGKHEVAELVRVALRDHKTPVSRILKYAVAMVREANPGLRLLASYADTSQGHHGGIYQACGWTYLGRTSSTTAYEVDGKMVHKRVFTGANFGAAVKALPRSAVPRLVPGKHRYALGLDDGTKAWLQARALLYPKRAASIGVDASALQAEEAGSLPSAALPEAP